MSRDKLILLVGLITYGMGQSLLFVIFTPLARDLGLVESQLGFIIAASNVALAFSAVVWGRASNRMGRRRVFLIGLGGYAVGYAALAFGVQAGLWGWVTAVPLFVLLIVLRLAYGLVVGGINPAAAAYIADTTEEKDRAQGMALVAMSGGLGTIIGPAFGGALAAITPVFPMYAAAGLAVLALAWAWVGLPEPARRAGQSPAVRVAILDPRSLPYLVGWLIVFGVFTGVQTITAAFVEDRYGITDVTAGQRTMMFAMLSMAVFTLLVQAGVLQKWKPKPAVMLRIAFVLMTCGLLLLSVGTTPAALYAGYGIFGLSFGFAAPGLNAAGSLSVRREEQGAVAGLLSAAPTVGMIIGPILSGVVYRTAPGLPILAGAVLTAAMATAFFFIRVPEPRG